MKCIERCGFVEFCYLCCDTKTKAFGCADCHCGQQRLSLFRDGFDCFLEQCKGICGQIFCHSCDGVVHVFADQARSYCDADGEESETLEKSSCIVCVAVYFFLADLGAEEFEALLFSEQG